MTVFKDGVLEDNLLFYYFDLKHLLQKIELESGKRVTLDKTMQAIAINIKKFYQGVIELSEFYLNSLDIIAKLKPQNLNLLLYLYNKLDSTTVYSKSYENITSLIATKYFDGCDGILKNADQYEKLFTHIEKALTSLHAKSKIETVEAFSLFGEFLYDNKIYAEAKYFIKDAFSIFMEKYKTIEHELKLVKKPIVKIKSKYAIKDIDLDSINDALSKEIDSKVYTSYELKNPSLKFTELLGKLLIDKYKNYKTENLISKEGVIVLADFEVLVNFEGEQDAFDIGRVCDFFQKYLSDNSTNNKKVNDFIECLCSIFEACGNDIREIYPQIRLSVIFSVRKVVNKRIMEIELLEQAESIIYKVISDYGNNKLLKNKYNKDLSFDNIKQAINFLKILTEIKIKISERDVIIISHTIQLLENSRDVAAKHKFLKNAKQLTQMMQKSLEITINSRDKKIDFFGHIVCISDVNSKIKSLLRQKKISFGWEIKIVASELIHYDIKSMVTKGMNVITVSPNHRLANRINKFNLNVDAPHASFPAHKEISCGKSGTKKSINGKRGSDGSNGLYGQAAGNILIVGINVDKDIFRFSAVGGNAQSGQDGTDGGNGYNGKDGKAGEVTPDFKLLRSYASFIQYEHGESGTPGGLGGDAGYAGAKGLGGAGGICKIIDLNLKSQNLVYTKTYGDGKDGKPGKSGKPGKGGISGKKGKDCYFYKKWSLNIATYKKQGTKIEGLYVNHEDVDRESKSGLLEPRWLKNYKKPKVIIADYDPDKILDRAEQGHRASRKNNFKKQNSNAKATLNTEVTDLIAKLEVCKQHWNNEVITRFTEGLAKYYHGTDILTGKEQTKSSILLRELLDSSYKNNSTEEKMIQNAIQEHESILSKNSDYTLIDSSSLYTEALYTQSILYSGNKVSGLLVDINSINCEDAWALSLKKLLHNYKQEILNRKIILQQILSHIEYNHRFIVHKLDKKILNELCGNIFNDLINMDCMDYNSLFAIEKIMIRSKFNFNKIDLVLNLLRIDKLAVYKSKILALNTDRDLKKLEDLVYILADEFKILRRLDESIFDGYININKQLEKFVGSVKKFNDSLDITDLYQVFHHLCYVLSSHESKQLFFATDDFKVRLSKFTNIFISNINLYKFFQVEETIKRNGASHLHLELCDKRVENLIGEIARCFGISLNVSSVPLAELPDSVLIKYFKFRPYVDSGIEILRRYKAKDRLSKKTYLIKASELFATSMIDSLAENSSYKIESSLCELEDILEKVINKFKHLDLHQDIINNLEILLLFTRARQLSFQKQDGKDFNRETLKRLLDFIAEVHESTSDNLLENKMVYKSFNKKVIEIRSLKLEENNISINQAQELCGLLNKLHVNIRARNNNKYATLETMILLTLKVITKKICAMRNNNKLKSIKAQFEFIADNNLPTKINFIPKDDYIINRELITQYIKAKLDSDISEDIKSQLISEFANDLTSSENKISIGGTSDFDKNFIINGQKLKAQGDTTIYIFSVNNFTLKEIININGSGSFKITSMFMGPNNNNVKYEDLEQVSARLNHSLADNFVLVNSKYNINSQNIHEYIRKGNARKNSSRKLLVISKKCVIYNSDIHVGQDLFVRNNFIDVKSISLKEKFDNIINLFNVYKKHEYFTEQLLKNVKLHKDIRKLKNITNFFGDLESKILNSYLKECWKNKKVAVTFNDILDLHELREIAFAKAHVKLGIAENLAEYLVKEVSNQYDARYVSEIIHKLNTSVRHKVDMEHFVEQLRNDKVQKVHYEYIVYALNMLEKQFDIAYFEIPLCKGKLEELICGLSYIARDSQLYLYSKKLQDLFASTSIDQILNLNTKDSSLIKYLVVNSSEYIEKLIVLENKSLSSITKFTKSYYIEHIKNNYLELFNYLSKDKSMDSSKVRDIMQYFVKANDEIIEQGLYIKQDNLFRLIYKISLVVGNTNEGLLISAVQFVDVLLVALKLIENNIAEFDTVVNILKTNNQLVWCNSLFTEIIIYVYEKMYAESSQNTIGDLKRSVLVLDHHVIKVLSNALVKSYLESKSKEVISEYDFKQIFYFLENKISLSHTDLEFLSGCSISQWLQYLQKLDFENQILNISGLSIIKSELLKQQLNSIRKEVGYKRYLEIYETIDSIVTHSNIPGNINKILNIVELTYTKKISFEDFYKIAQQDISIWPDEIDALIKNKRANKSANNLDDIADIIKRQQVDSSKVDSILSKAKNIKQEVLNNLEILKNYSKEQKNNFKNKLSALQYCKSLKERCFTYEQNFVEFTAIVISIYVYYQLDKMENIRDTQLFSILLFLDSQDSNMLQQVHTGEGKTLITSIITCIKALQGFNVDVVSSNHDLVKAGYLKSEKFFKFFETFGSSSTYLCADTENDSKIYKNQIVYGTAKSFQNDRIYLLLYKLRGDKFKEEDKAYGRSIQERYDSNNNYLIIDEVDSILLDKMNDVVYRSHLSEQLFYLESLFVFIWTAAISIDERSQSVEQVQAAIENMIKVTKLHIDKGRLYVPQGLRDYVELKLEAWFKSAFSARFMDNKKNFVLDVIKDKSQDSIRQLIIIDKSTGAEQYNSRWTDGLSLFLDLKFHNKICAESLKVYYISNFDFIKSYGNKVYGLTGTLGNEIVRKSLNDLYKVTTLNIPTNMPSKFFKVNDRVDFTREGWLASIKNECDLRKDKQPILIICDTISDAEVIYSKVSKLDGVNLFKYYRAEHEIENIFDDQGGAKANDIIIATNKGGRGTDIPVYRGDEQEDEGLGLHVILSYVPVNSRVEHQAFGRTARNGSFGTGNFIVCLPEADKSLADEPTVLIEHEKDKLAQLEANKLNSFNNAEKLQIDMRSYLLDEYIKFAKTVLKNLDILSESDRFQLPDKVNKAKKNKETKEGKSSTKPENNIKLSLTQTVFTIIEDKWALFMSKLETEITKIDSIEAQERLKQKAKSEFFDVVNDNLSKKKIKLDFFATSPEYMIKIAKFYFSIKNFESALHYYKQAIESGDLSGCAGVGACVSSIKIDSKNNLQNRKQLRKYLKHSIQAVEKLRYINSVNVNSVKTLYELTDNHIAESEEENTRTSLVKQYEDRIKFLSDYLNYLYSISGAQLTKQSFIMQSTTESNISGELSTKIYKVLKNNNIIKHNYIRNYWKRAENRDKLKFILQQELSDYSITVLLGLLRDKKHITNKSISPAVYSSDEVWEILQNNNIISQDYNYLEFETPINLDKLESKEQDKLLSLLTLHGIENSKSGAHFFKGGSDFYNKLTSAPNYREIFNKLLEQKVITCSKYADTKPGVELPQNIFGKYLKYYKKIKSSDNEQRTVNYYDFLAELFKNINSDSGILKFKQLGLNTRKHEIRVIKQFLYSNNIVKGGVLNCYKKKFQKSNFGITVQIVFIKDKIENDILKAVSLNTVQRKYVKEVLNSLPGSIRTLDDDFAADFIDTKKKFGGYFRTDFDYIGLNKTLVLSTVSHLKRDLIICACIGGGFIVAGILLMVLTQGIFALIGLMLIYEGVSDLVYTAAAYSAQSFSWRDYAIQKGISVILSSLVVTAPLAGGAILASKAIKGAELTAYVAKFITTTNLTTGAEKAIKAAMGVTVKIGSFVGSKAYDKFMEEVKEKVVKEVKNKCYKGLMTDIKKLVDRVYYYLNKNINNDSQFAKESTRIKNIINHTLHGYGFDEIVQRFLSHLKQQALGVIEAILDNFKNVFSGSEVASFVIAITKMLVSAGLRITNAITINKETKQKLREVLNVLQEEMGVKVGKSSNLSKLSEDRKNKHEEVNKILEIYVEGKIKDITSEILSAIDSVRSFALNNLTNNMDKVFSNLVKSQIECNGLTNDFLVDNTSDNKFNLLLSNKLNNSSNHLIDNRVLNDIIVPKAEPRHSKNFNEICDAIKPKMFYKKYRARQDMQIVKVENNREIRKDNIQLNHVAIKNSLSRL